MSLSQDFQKIVREVFSLDPKWLEWFMKDCFKDDELAMSVVDSRPASVMLSTPYKMRFHGVEVECDYLSFVATVPSQRGKGLMRGLMRDTLSAAWEKRTPFALLIPATRPLYFIYDKMGFATVFYVDEERYTSLHEFEQGEYKAAEPSFELFRRLEDKREGAVLHTEKQFKDILNDLSLSQGRAVAVDDGNGSEAIAFAEVGGEIKILDLLSTDEKATDAVLCEAKKFGGEKSMIVNAVPGGNSKSLRARGMIRIVNALAVLEALAAGSPSIKMTIRLTDPFLPSNNGIYCLESGRCRRVDKSAHIDLDTTVDVMAKILFSDPKIGELFNLPTVRPFMSLMLD